MDSPLKQVADGVHRCADGLVNFYLVEEDGQLTVIDAGWRRSWSHLQRAVGELKRTLADVQAVLLSHGHPDHLGIAEKMRTALGAPVHAHRDEVKRAQGKADGASPFALVPALLPHLWQPSALAFVLHATGRGFMTPKWVSEVVAFDGDAPLDVPGRPRPLAAPGHTEGHTAYVLADRGVVFTGDALATLDVLTRERGPRLMPKALNVDHAQARGSLQTLESVEVETLLPGHGQPWHGRMADAVEQARRADQ